MAPTVEPVVDCGVVGLDAGFGPLAARLWGSYEENLCPFGEFDEVADVDDVFDGSVAFFERIWKTWKRMGFPIEAIVADNGPEYKATKFADALAAKNATRVFIPARSSNHNAVVERFQGPMLQECWRPAFHRLCFNSVRQLQREADAWCHTYNHRLRYASSSTTADVAERYGHLTPQQTGRLARVVGIRRLVLSHFSRRYPDPALFVSEAGAEVDGVAVARDLDRVAVPQRR
jgi:hypothetical protein